MRGKKAISLLLPLLLFLLPSVCGITFFQNEESVLWGSCKNRTYAVSTATIDIYYPNNTIWKNGETMTNVSVGLFNYTFIAPNVTGNYLTTIECTIGGVTGFDEDDFWVREAEEEMTSMAVVIFIITLTIGIFILPRFFKMENQYLDWTLKSCLYILGLFLVSLDVAMVATVAEKANLGITSEIFMLLWISTWGTYLAMVVVILTFGWKSLQLWKYEKAREREGEEW